MRINSITSALAIALYSAGSMYAAAGIAPTEEINTLNTPNLTQEQINELQLGANRTTTGSMMENDGLNVQVNSQRAKFFEEADITGPQIYVVRLQDKPTALYTGGITGLQGTHVNTLSQDLGINSLYEAGKPTTERVVEYTNYLHNQQLAAISEMNRVVGTKEVRKQFTTAVNAYTVEMTQEEAKRVSQLPQVEFVHRAKTYELHTDAGPQKISADQVWTGATDQGVEFKGEGIIMGIIDTGVNSDHPSFADIGGDGYDHENPWAPGVYVGACAEAGNEDLCNDKLIGIRTYDVITDAFAAQIPGFPAIGEDYQGHGSHVASTAAGNVLNDVDFVLPDYSGMPSDGVIVKEDMYNLSGVAPHANIISYQVCHASNDAGFRGCPWEAMIGGIEDAIEDGVDVINFSIGGQDSTSPWDDGVELGFLAAREAGISVAVAAGNGGQPFGSGEYFGSIDHASPWLASVAATTHDRKTKVETPVSFVGYANNEAGEPLGSEVPWWSEQGLIGGAINDTEVTGVVVWAKDYADINGSKDWNGFCGTEYPAGTFDFYKDGTPIVGAAEGDTDVIVVCQRNSLQDANGIARTAKVANVKAGGADGFIMFNYSKGDSVPIVAYELPSLHVTKEVWDGEITTYGAEGYNYGLEDFLDDRDSSWATTSGQMITIGKTAIYNDHNEENGDWLAGFSSRGPSTSTPEMLIPQIAAPGVNVYAAWADEHPFIGEVANSDYNAISGTSMASPHVAGAMALIRQAHPDWTPTEVQSALMLTADNVVRYRRLNEGNGSVGSASTYRAGAGRINVAEAIDTGLVMDETIENFKAANPGNGGQVHRLNIPQLVNLECKPTCQWTRTFKATKDGDWSVSHSDVLNWNFDMNNQSAQNGVSITASPSEFSLQAGETQTVVFEASIMDTQDWFSNAEVELHSDVILTDTSEMSTEVHLPVAFKFSKNGMPSRLRAVAHRNEGSFQFNNLELPALDNPYTRVYAPVKADVQTVALPKDDDGYFPWSAYTDDVPASFRIDEATKVEMIEVPAGAKRLVVEVQGTIESELEGHMDKGNALVYVGKDYNGNGEAEPFEEILCVSNHIEFNNFCNINNPEEGTYWAIIYNVGDLKGQAPTWTERYPDLGDEVFAYAIAVVTDEVASDMSLDVAPTDGKDTVSATLNYDMPEMMEGDVYYSVLDFGTSEINAGNVGKVAFKLERGVDDVNLDVTQTRARAGDVVPYTFEVQPNDTGADRAFTITATMPEGLDFSAEDVLSSNEEIVTDVMVEGNVVTISGVQPNTGGMKPYYIQTTNVEDEMCRMPNFGNSNPGGYVDLEEFGFDALFSGFNSGVDENGNPVGDNNLLYRDGIHIPVSMMFNGQYDSWHLYNNSDGLNINPQNFINLRGNGLFDLWGHPMFFPYHLPFPYNSFPYESVGPLWRGMGVAEMSSPGNPMMSVPLINSWSETAGITLASTQQGWGIIEVDNARSYINTGRDWSAPGRPYTWEEKDDRFDFEVIFNVNTRHGKNQHELYFAYDNIDFGDQNGRGSIGLQGFTGPIYSRGPVEGGYMGNSYALDDLDSKIHDGLVICYDYYGPESSQFEVTIWTQVKRDAVGTDQVFMATSQVEGMADFAMSHTLELPSNIQLTAIADMETDENESVDVNVYYADNSELASVNEIIVSGDNVSGIVESHESGSSISIVPAANFHGMTEVTVTVADVENPADKASTTFMLNVISDNVEFGCTDSNASNYDSNANTDDGSCEYPEPPGQEKKKSGGSLGYLALMLLAMAGMRRRIK